MKRTVFSFLRVAAIGLASLYLAGAAISADAPASAQAPSPAAASVEGSFTEAQAKRGKQLSADNCASCHSEDLSGGGIAPALAGDGFMALWDGRSVADLYDRVRTTMPAQAPASLTDDEYIDIVAFLLQANNVKAGERQLKATAPELKTMVLSRAAVAR